MNREIKFRAWDSFNAVFYYSDNMKSKKISDFFKCCEMCTEGGNGIIYQQYTGLRDKNGKEIYEGDIVKLPVLTLGGYTLQHVEYRAEIAAYVRRTNDKSGFVRLEVRINQAEVVGNIYEKEKVSQDAGLR